MNDIPLHQRREIFLSLELLAHELQWQICTPLYKIHNDNQ